MSNAAKSLEPAFQGAGQKGGTEIWRIENFQPVPLPKPDYGKFYSGDSYIILQTIAGKAGGFHYDMHFWLGKDTSQDEAGTAAIKTIELDAILGGRAVQYRELQGHESDKFLSYFKPCIIPLEGGVASGFKTPVEQFETRLYICRGKRVVRLKQVPFSRSSLNHDDIFILDSEKKIYQFNGANSNIQERAKALEVIQFLKEKYHRGTCDVAIVDDGKLKAESDSGEFWVLFGGFAPIGKKVVTQDDIIAEKTSPQLYSINGQVKAVDGELSKSLLENNKCYLLDCGNEIFVWVGRVTQVDERKAATQTAEEFITSQSRPKSTQIIRLIQGHENHSFKSKFDSWPSTATTSVVEEGRGKVAALLKQQGGGVKGAAAKSAPVVEEVPPLLEGGGKIEVWRVDGSEKTAVPAQDIGRFYCGDCYAVLYTYHHHERKEDFFLCCWIGKDSIQEEAEAATRLCNTMYSSLKGRAVQGRIYQGKEPPQFIAIFQPMVILKGGMSSGYKSYIAEKGVKDETYTGDGVALFVISGTALHNNKAVQVDAVAASLNSNECFLLQSGTTVFNWMGNQSTVEQQQLAAKVAEFLKPGSPLKHTKEGTEGSVFWGAVGGKKPYTSKKAAQEPARDPHLFAFSFCKGKFEIEEIYRFSQDDLLTEDMLILDTRGEVFIWVGSLVDSKEKQSAFEIGQKYVDIAASLEGLALNVPLYKVAEGNEPCFFTTHFSWDPAKASTHGNSFQKKALQIFGVGHEDKSNASNDGGPTQRASALAALNSAFNSTSSPASSPKPVIAPRGGAGQGSQRAAAVAALSNVLTAEKRSPDSSPSRRLRSPHAEASPTARTPRKNVDAAPAPAPAPAPEPEEPKESEPSEPNEETNGETEQNNNAAEAVQETYTYEQLRSKSENPVTGINTQQREAYLSEEEFETVFEMRRETFYRNPKWKQDLLKKKADLF